MLEMSQYRGVDCTKNLEGDFPFGAYKTKNMSSKLINYSVLATSISFMFKIIKMHNIYRL